MRAWRIYLGRKRPGGEHVSDKELRTFIRTVVRPRFHAFTIHRAVGYWENTSEPSLIIELVDPPADAQEDIRTVAEAYKVKFQQDAVLVVGSFVDSVLV